MNNHYYLGFADPNGAISQISVAAKDGVEWAITGTSIFIVGIASISLIKYFFDKIGN